MADDHRYRPVADQQHQQQQRDDHHHRPRGPVTSFAESHRFFTAHPYTSDLLSAPSLSIFLPNNRTPKSSTEDSLFASTLARPDTVNHILAFYPRPDRAAPHITTCTTLFALGSQLNGFPRILHGGIVATLLDEAVGVLLTADADRRHLRDVAVGKKDGENAEGTELFTTRLDVRYLAPVETPGVVRVVVEEKERKGRWVRVEAELRQWRRKEGVGHAYGYGRGEGSEVVCSRGMAEFVRPKEGVSRL